MSTFEISSLRRTCWAPSVPPAPQSVITIVDPTTATIGDTTTTIRAIAPTSATG